MNVTAVCGIDAIAIVIECLFTVSVLISSVSAIYIG